MGVWECGLKMDEYGEHSHIASFSVIMNEFNNLNVHGATSNRVRERWSEERKSEA